MVPGRAGWQHTPGGARGQKHSDTARLQQQDSWQLDQDWDFIMEECYDAQEEIDAAEDLEMQELEEAHRRRI